MSLPNLNQPFVKGSIQSPVGAVPQVDSRLSSLDQWGSIKARWGVGRMHYAIEPGLYALGNPGPQSQVLVTANYKMSFDRLREALPGKGLWILVLDTKGINVWCAAGKGSFGTEELVRRIASNGLTQVVSHRELILPQLAGPGVSAHQVKKLSGFKVTYGPIRAADIPSFLDSGLKATPEMRRKTFTTKERAVLIPIELVSILKWVLFIIPGLFLVGGLGGQGGFWSNAMDHGIFAILAFLGAVTAGAVFTPLLLPWIPGRAFFLKGIFMGAVMAGLFFGMWGMDSRDPVRGLEFFAWTFLMLSLSAYLAMNFTGASTYTSLSGVRKEMKWAVPFEIVAGSVGMVLWIGSRFVA